MLRVEDEGWGFRDCSGDRAVMMNEDRLRD
jgi:hypothetical protein